MSIALLFLLPMREKSDQHIRVVITTRAPLTMLRVATIAALGFTTANAAAISETYPLTADCQVRSRRVQHARFSSRDFRDPPRRCRERTETAVLPDVAARYERASFALGQNDRVARRRSTRPSELRPGRPPSSAP